MILCKFSLTVTYIHDLSNLSTVMGPYGWTLKSQANATQRSLLAKQDVDVICCPAGRSRRFTCSLIGSRQIKD
jgi:hypothetical protein